MSKKNDRWWRDRQSIPQDVSAFEPLLEYIEESARWLASELNAYPKPFEALDMVQAIFDIDNDGPGQAYLQQALIDRTVELLKDLRSPAGERHIG